MPAPKGSKYKKKENCFNCAKLMSSKMFDASVIINGERYCSPCARALTKIIRRSEVDKEYHRQLRLHKLGVDHAIIN